MPCEDPPDILFLVVMMKRSQNLSESLRASHMRVVSGKVSGTDVLFCSSGVHLLFFILVLRTGSSVLCIITDVQDSVRQRIGSECIVDEATGPISQKLIKLSEEGANKSAIPPLSATRLEQMSKAVRLLVLELLPGASTAISQPSNDSRPADDMSQ